jgi:hypothetical protein
MRSFPCKGNDSSFVTTEFHTIISTSNANGINEKLPSLGYENADNVSQTKTPRMLKSCKGHQ